jgi:hypothetical protein
MSDKPADVICRICGKSSKTGGAWIEPGWPAYFNNKQYGNKMYSVNDKKHSGHALCILMESRKGNIEGVNVITMKNKTPTMRVFIAGENSYGRR